MTADGLWIPHACRQPRIYQPRLRRDCPGELIQIDDLRFCEKESALYYILSTWDYINKHGKHVAFCSDKHAVFCVNQAETCETGTTQFGHVLHDLNIKLICANSPQAKGRVEL
jgi:hypothetical protein